MNRPGWVTLLRDVVLFCTGLAIVLKQAGLLPPDFSSPTGGPSFLLLAIGAVFCNGPLMLPVLQAIFRGGSSPGPSEPAPPSPLPSSAASPGAD